MAKLQVWAAQLPPNKNENETRHSMTKTTTIINELIIYTIDQIEISDICETIASWDFASDDEIDNVINKIDDNVPLSERFDHWVNS